ncbi:aldehyde dehydrogenase family protein [Streptosporangium sandarakinum]|uniref:Acyl-CoA reductase-like NAD-dependent aldehyde dehydrogenase n=1 Tax=Streptosporangium sandarakinum TaxID=1260955 RepID=A0A852V0P5_9ACTN|nr:aldehyde dehydrogenase family protein [Streptosporangium sandarakinum]NYF39355.1 acyl-CoA reductase-like NAD-dependent aldehyde dehydrogenase [Streptosporangium sandarakinum]
MDVRPFWLAGRPATGDAELTVTNSHDGRVVGVCSVPTPEQVEEAVAAADAVRKQAAALPLHVRAAALTHVVRRLTERAEEIARLIMEENGKPIFWARGEVGRAISTFQFAAEEARRLNGETVRLDTEAASAGRLAYVSRVPHGPVLAITPFNFPLNLVAHKVAPAIAVGAPIIVKPAPATPLSSLVLGEILAETDLPAGMFSVLPVPNDRASALVEDPRLPVVSFTGSGPVGYAIMDQVPRKHVTLELGGNAAAVVLADADLDWAASRTALFSNYQAGQSCISVQRVIVEERVSEAFLAKLIPAVEALVTGDPADEKTQVGPLVSVEAAERVESWVKEAVAAGARLLTGGTRDGATVAPTVLADVPRDTKLGCEEVFGPVMTVQTVSGVDEAFAAVNDSRYGLQAGVFTRNLDIAFRANRELEVGGVIIGDVPSYRADQMPYGGVKDSGVGREGVRSAMEDLTYEKVMVLTGLSSL